MQQKGLLVLIILSCATGTPYHHHGEPEVRNVALVERGQRMAGRAELRHDTGDCPDNGKIDEGRFHE